MSPVFSKRVKDLNRILEDLGTDMQDLIDTVVEESKQEGYQEGFEKGEDSGYTKGYDTGKEDGVNEERQRWQKKEKVDFT